MTPQIKSTQGFGVRQGVKILTYGRAGVGKTMLCATAPSPIILSAEGGLLSLAQYQLPYIEIKTLEDLHQCYMWLSSSKDAKQFQTICLDSISEMAEVILADAKAKIGTGDVRRAYGQLIDRTLDMLKKFRDLKGFHLYVSAKQEQTKTENGIVINAPMMPGAKVGPQLPYLFDEVFQLAIEGTAPAPTYRYLRTQPDMLSDAKDRSGRLDVIEKPDLTHIINKIVGS